jgi:hypothetical protein
LSGRRQGVGTEDGGGRGHDAVDGGEVTLVGVGHVGGDGLLPRVLHEKLLRFLWPTVWNSLHGLMHGLVVARRLFGSSHVLQAMHQSMQAIPNGGPQESQQFFMQHPRQQSIPANMTYPNQGHLSPVNGIMSPPSSVLSANSLSPPGQAGTPPHSHAPPHLSTSPVKSRPGIFPTSPTHMQALRGATHQRHQSFDFPDAATQQHQQQQMTNMQMQSQFYPHFPTPPQTGGVSSPDSPWSTQQSPSSWSDGIQSPPHQSVHSPPQSMYPQNHPENNKQGIFI